MTKLLAATAMLLVLAAGGAFADQVIGTVEKVDPDSNTVWIKGTPYQFESQLQKLKVEDVKVGDELRLNFNDQGAANEVYEAEHVKK